MFASDATAGAVNLTHGGGLVFKVVINNRNYRESGLNFNLQCSGFGMKER